MAAGSPGGTTVVIRSIARNIISLCHSRKEEMLDMFVVMIREYRCIDIETLNRNSPNVKN